MDIFLKIDKKDLNIFEIMHEAKENSISIIINKHDNRCVRQPYNVSFDECLNIFKESEDHMHWVFILRQSYYSSLWLNGNKNLEKFWEIGGCTLGRKDGDVFLFINTTVDEGFKLQQKYNLQTMGKIPDEIFKEYEKQRNQYLK